MSLLLNHAGPLPTELVDGMAGASTDTQIHRQLLRRPELSDTGIAAIEKHRPLVYSPEIAALLLARKPISTHDEFDEAIGKHNERSSTSRRPGHTHLAWFVKMTLESPCVRPELLDLMETCGNPVIVASYAHNSVREPERRAAALLHLDGLILALGRRRPHADAVNQGAKALVRLLAETPEVGRRTLLALNAPGGVLLNLTKDEGANYDHKVALANLDAETRAHVVRVGLAPVLTANKVTDGDRDAALELTRALAPDLDTAILEQLAGFPFWGRSNIVEAELRKRTNNVTDLLDHTLRDLAVVSGLTATDRESAARWIYEQATAAAAQVGWDSLITLAGQLPENMTLRDLNTTLQAIAAPAAEAS